MCGIFGGFSESGTVDTALLDQIRRLAESRGRDGSQSKQFRFDDGSNAIIGTCRATPSHEIEIGQLQPYDGVCHNGTIANDVELGRKEGEIDSQVLPRILDRSSFKAFHKSLKKIVGSYAIIATSEETNSVFLACNYKPLHYIYHCKTDTIYFASLLQHLLPVKEFGLSPVQLPPYTALDLKTKACLPISREFKERALIVASAGLDSITAAAYMKSEGFDIRLLNFSYGSTVDRKEFEYLLKCADDLDVSLDIIDIPFDKMAGKSSIMNKSEKAKPGAGMEFAHEWVPARNLVFSSLAAAYAEANGYHIVVLGINLEESIPGDTVIPIKSKDGVNLLKIEDLFKQKNKQFEVVTINKEGIVEIQPCLKVLKHQCNYNELITITDQFKRQIQVTPCHSVVVYREDEFTEVRADEIKITDYLLTPMKPTLIGKNITVTADKNFLKNIPSLICDNNTVRSKTRSNKIPLKIILDEKIMEFFGFWIGDGCYDTYSIVMSTGKDQIELVNNLIKPICKRFNLSYKEHAKNTGDVWINSAVFKYFMQSIGFTGKCYTKEVPNWVVNLKPSLVCAFLRGYFTADGHRGKSCVSLFSVNKKLIRQVQTLTLLTTGIIGCISIEYDKKYNRNGYIYKITDRQLLTQFMEKIGFILIRKNKAFTSKKQKKPSIFGVPWTNEIQKVFNENNIVNNKQGGRKQLLSEKLKLYFLGRSKKDRNCQSKVRKEEIVSLSKNTKNNTINMLAESEVYFCSIKSIDSVKAPEFVYDLQVKDNENFMLANGIIVHNSGSHPDNEEQMVFHLNSVFNYAVRDGYQLKITAPLGNLMKHEIVKLAKKCNAPLHNTWSCYNNGEFHCGECGPCHMRLRAFKRSGLIDPVKYEKLPSENYWFGCVLY